MTALWESAPIAALAGSVFGPLCATVRILALISFGGLMVEVSIPWRFRVCLAILLGWAAAGSGGVAEGASESWAVMAASELALGSAMGVAVGGLMMSLKLAGELLDDRLRLADATGEAMASENELAGPCVRLLGGLGLVLVLFGGAGDDMPVLEGILASFRSTPVGSAMEAFSDWRGVLVMLNGSLELALRTALPVLGAVTIIDWCQVLAARAAPSAPSALAATTVKPLLGLAVLVATFGGACEATLAAVRACLGGA